MRSSNRFRSIRVATATAIAVVSGTAGLASLISLTSTAQADPASTTAEVGVGADVTQDLFAALTGASPSPGNGAQSGTFDTTQFYTPLHSSNATGDVTIASFDASPPGGTTVNPGAIVTKTGGPAFDRPNSSTAGIAALDDLVNLRTFQNSSGDAVGPQSVVGQIDFARSARGPATGASAKPGSDLTFIPYARDALGFLVYDPAGYVGNSLTTANLASLYGAGSTGHITVTSGANSENLNACLTISGSTPRSNLESILSVSDANAGLAATDAHCNSVQQNSGNSFLSAAQASGDTGAYVIPISSASWISQANGLALDRSNLARGAGIDLASVNDSSLGGGALGQPYTGTAPTELPNTTYFQSALGYDVYTVVPTSSISGGFTDPALIDLFVGPSSELCQSSEQSLINKFGFDSLTPSEGTCGSTTTQADG